MIVGPGSSKLGFRTTAAIIFGRLVLVPPVGLGIVMFADKLGFLPPGDKMFRFVLLLQHTMPTSVLSGKHPFLISIGSPLQLSSFFLALMHINHNFCEGRPFHIGYCVSIRGKSNHNSVGCHIKNIPFNLRSGRKINKML